MIERGLSFAVLLLRGSDSLPPDRPVHFWSEGKELTPYAKPGGLYVFVDRPERELLICCEGYQDQRVTARDNETALCVCYPAGGCLPPPGWRLSQGRGAPGEIGFVPAAGEPLRVLSRDVGRREARVWAGRGGVSGTLLLSWENGRELALVLERGDADLVLLDRLPEEFTGGAARRVYPGRADSTGLAHALVPDEKGGDRTWEWL